MDPLTIAQAAVEAELAAPSFRLGVKRRRWRLLKMEFPYLFIEVSGVTSDGAHTAFSFRFLVDQFPVTPPDVRCWDMDANTTLPPDRRPKGPPRTAEAFKEWGYGVYRPWDRHGISHNNWMTDHPHLAWHARRSLTFILEDLHELLNPYPAKPVSPDAASTSSAM
ncbi:DUF7665 family protein [Noviherbaspirillum malthae]|uniref:DUF7665 family protein n=1 Tax=Noviherbaspirillum malthae TaxID=1260987 RepID=UPI003F6A2F0B